MAQLIKLEDYISRYEWNIYRYPGQFIRMKQENWKKRQHLWQSDLMAEKMVQSEPVSMFSKWKSILRMGSRQTKKASLDEEDSLPKTEQALKHDFLDDLLPRQLKWASSTVTDVSIVKQQYYDDARLKYFLQRFPDTYLLMYYPIFNVKKAPVDGEIILISPLGIDIIYMIEKASGTRIWADDERTWVVRGKSQQETRILSPTLALKRTEQIVKSVLNRDNLDLPITKVVLAPVNDIVFHNEPYNTKLIGRQAYADWFSYKRNLISPLKNQQLKAAEGLLKNCRTSALKRPEWEPDNDSFTAGNGEK
ncbi:NERD domain-containing protein [Lentibacillus salinarum]|uniref:NERD domain-containing protein n=1 Tax=Lentibacillus salinarum TaxID=446820 RepID=A0ABW3ZVW8_9BACI